MNPEQLPSTSIIATNEKTPMVHDSVHISITEIKKENVSDDELESNVEIIQELDVDGIKYETINYKCDNCEFTTTCNNTYQKHCVNCNALSKTERSFDCEVCGKSLCICPTGTNLFQCAICNETFSDILCLKAHVKSHSGKTFTCEVCAEIFSRKCDLITHGMIHTGEGLFHCEICGRGFTNKGRLKNHMRSHGGVKQVICEICDKIFIEGNTLRRHMMAHTGEKPFSCEVCGKHFVTNDHVKTHMRVHTGEKPFKCEICGKSFASYYLKAHMRVHTGERPFKCEICGKSFASSSNCKEHQRIHERGIQRHRKSKETAKDVEIKS